MAAAATLAHSVPLGKRPRTDRRSVADRRSEVSGMEKKGNFKVLSSLLSVNPGRREVSKALSQTPRTSQSLHCDAFGWWPVPCACGRFYYLMRSRHRPPGPGQPPRGWHSFYETAGEELRTSLVPDRSSWSHFPFLSLGGTWVQVSADAEAEGAPRPWGGCEAGVQAAPAQG